MTVRLKATASKVKPIPPTRLESYRKALLVRRETLATELRQATASFIADETVYSDATDQASADADKSLLLQMKNRDRNILWQIDAALKRIDQGIYGECEQCNDAIAEARIRAFPLTTLCIDCKAELESREHRFPRGV
jgi:DnaK suppressor protein